MVKTNFLLSAAGTCFVCFHRCCSANRAQNVSCTFGVSRFLFSGPHRWPKRPQTLSVYERRYNHREQAKFTGTCITPLITSPAGVQILPGVRSNDNGVNPGFAGVRVGGMRLTGWP